jgi:hypothetical protein
LNPPPLLSMQLSVIPYVIINDFPHHPYTRMT